MKLKIKSIEGIFYTIDISLEKASEGCKNPYGDSLNKYQADNYNRQCDFIERKSKVSSYIDEAEINLLHECLIMPTIIKHA
jgi:hypothetical protein